MAKGYSQDVAKAMLNNMGESTTYNIIHKGNGVYAISKVKNKYHPDTNLTNNIQQKSQSIEPLLDRLENLYGIKFIRVTNEDIEESGLTEDVPDAQFAKAFILDGEIYINTDNATADSPIHELGHLLLGTLRQTNPELYQTMVNSVENYEDYEYELKKYRHRSRMDANEEIFVDLFARHYSQGYDLNIDQNMMNDAEYEIRRNIDSAIFPNTSTTKEPMINLMEKSLSEIMDIFGTAINRDTLTKAFKYDIGSMSRTVANIKESLFKNNDLKEYCNG